MKRLFTFLVALAVAGAVSAQTPFAPKQAETGVLKKNHVSVTNTQKKSPRRIQLADNQLLMGGYATDDVATSNEGLGVGSYATGTLRAAIYLPIDDVAAFDGGKVVKMRVGLANSATISRVFITPVVNGYIQDDIVSQSVRGNSAGWNEFDIDVPVDLDFKGVDALLMGYDYEQVSNSYPISTAEVGDPHYLYIYGNLGQGTGYYSFGDSYGNLSVQAVVEKEFTQYAAEPQPIGDFIVPFGGSQTVSLPVKNMGKATITSIGYTLTIDQQATEATANISSGVAFGSVGYAYITVPSADVEKTQNYELTITKVNGEDNASTNNTISGRMASTSKQYQQRVAVEEFTGTGCQYCPRGMVGMEMMRHAYGDNFVGIALHQYNSGDAMYLNPNNYANLGFSGAPSCSVNRLAIVDPYYGAGNDNFGISQILDLLIAQPAFADISADAKWNEDSTLVVANAKVEGVIEGTNYDVEFVLIADSLTGNTSAWYQTNYYAQYTAAQVGQDLAPFAKGGEYGSTSVRGYKFNDVAVSSSYSGGVNQAKSVTISAAGQPEDISYELPLPTSATLKNALNKGLMFVAVLIINPTDGSVVNAIKVQVVGEDKAITAINNAVQNATNAQSAIRFTLDGRQLSAPQHGLNIVRMADGTTRKIFVK